MGRQSPFALLAPAVALLSVLAGCTEPEPRSEPSTDPQRIGELRLVSMSPALSRTLVDFGLERRIVGRSPFCDFLDDDVPIVGDLRNINYERLIELAPTHVLVQAEPDQKLLALAAERGWCIGRWGTIDTIDDIERTVRELPGRLLPPGTEDLEDLTARSADLLNEIAAALAPGAGADRLWRGSTLLVYAVQPVGVFGRGTYLHDVLARFGVENAAPAERWAELSLEDVTRLNPQAIILVRPGAGESINPMEAAGPLATLEIDAVRNQRIAVLSHPDALRPCTGIIGVAAEMRERLISLGVQGGSGS
jgi:ABC-type Fe3+-hydroxamate transport system substrate-binding protein